MFCCPRNTGDGGTFGPFARHCGIATSSTCKTVAHAGYRFGMTQPTRLTAADRRRFAPIIAARVDELEAGVRDTLTVDELEDLACQASVRFQGAHVPGGVVEMLVGELTHRATPEAATMLAAFARLCAADVALAGRQALERLGLPDGALDPRVSQLGLLRATEVRRTDLLRAQTWTLALQRSGQPEVWMALLAVELDGHGPLLARGQLFGPLSSQDGLDAVLDGGQDVEHVATTPGEAASALSTAAARNREIGYAVPHELAIMLPRIALALGLDVDALVGLPVAPEGETLWVDPEDEDAFARVAGLILDDFEDWGTADGRPHIHLIARSGWRVGAGMLDYARRANDGALGRWTTTDLNELFLRWIPEEEAFSHQEMLDAPDVAKELLSYLHESGRASGADALEVLLQRCDALRPDFEEAWSDRSRRGPTQSLVMQMREEGVDPTDPEALQTFMDDFNARPFEQRDAILGPPLDLRALPRSAGAAGGGSGEARKAKRRSAKASRKRNR